MKPLAAVLLFAAVASCGGPPRIAPAAPAASDELVGRCLTAFPAPDFRVVHSITAELPGGATGVFLGVAATSDGGRRFRGNLLSLEGMVLVDVEWSAEGLVVHRALPPLDGDGFAAGMADDMRLLLLPPPGAPREVGADDEGRTVCRWSGADGAVGDVAVDADGSWTATTWDGSGDRRREVRAIGPMRDGLAARMKLTASGEGAYSLVLELVEVEAVGEASASDGASPP